MIHPDKSPIENKAVNPADREAIHAQYGDTHAFFPESKPVVKAEKNAVTCPWCDGPAERVTHGEGPKQITGIVCPRCGEFR